MPPADGSAVEKSGFGMSDADGRRRMDRCQARPQPCGSATAPTPTDLPTMHSRLVRTAFAAALAAGLTVQATAQLQHNLSVAAGTHSHAAPYWTDNVPDANAEAGVVAQLNYVWWLDIRTQEVLLQPGTYVSQMRLAKTGGTAGQYDLTIRAESAGVALGSSPMPVALQTLDTYVWSPEVIFTVHQPSLVRIAARNTTNVLKQNYRFDTARIGRVPTGKAITVSSLTTWDCANPTFFDHYVAEPGSVYGRVRQGNLSGITWMHLNKAFTLLAGEHTCEVRMRNTGAFSNMPMTFEAYDTNNQLVASVTIPSSSFDTGNWFVSPPLRLTNANPTEYMFRLYNHGSNGVENVGRQYDCFTIRSMYPSFVTYGQGCGNLALAATSPAQLGTSFELQLQNATAALIGAFSIGTPIAPLPLAAIGAPNCYQHVAGAISVLAFVNPATGTANWSLGIPANPAFYGFQLDAQAAVLDQTAPGGVLTSNAGQAIVGF